MSVMGNCGKKRCQRLPPEAWGLQHKVAAMRGGQRQDLDQTVKGVRGHVPPANFYTWVF